MSSHSKGFAGVWTALVTPFTPTRRIDLPAYRRILKNQLEGGITGVIPCGTTGESPTLTLDEKKKLIRYTLDELRGTGLRVVAGTGSNDTAETVELSQWAADQGVDGVLVVTPYYNKPSQAGLEKHFRAVADAVGCPVILYNVPGRTGVSLAPETVVALAGHPRIRALKEATGNVALTSEILEQLRLAKRSMEILSGDDPTYLPLLGVGAVGVISVASNAIPRGMVAIQRAVEKGDWAEARRIHQHLYSFFRDIFVESNPVPIKQAMSSLGWCDPRVRPPLAPLGAGNVKKLRGTMKRCGIERGKAI